MRASYIVAAASLALVWGTYTALHRFPVSRHFQPERPPFGLAMMTFHGEGSTQDAHIPNCGTCLAAPVRPRSLELFVTTPFITEVDESAKIEAQLFYNDTIARPRLLRDSVGIRMIGSEGALAVQPTDTRYARVRGRIGPWDWIVTPQRAGTYQLMIDFVRLPGDLEELLHRPDTASVRRQGRLWYPPSPVLHRSTEIPLIVLTSSGWTATQDAWIRNLAWLASFLVIAVPVAVGLRKRNQPTK